MDELVNNSFIRSFHTSKRLFCRLFDRYEGSLVGSMGWRTYHIEFSGCIRRITFKCHFLCTLSDIKAILIAHFENFAISLYLTSSAYVENTYFTSFKKIVCTEVCPYIYALADGNCLIYRHTAKCHHPVNVRIYRYYLILFIQILNKEFSPYFLCGITLKISLINRISNIHFILLQ